MADGFALALQASLATALRADADIAALVGARVYDEPPQSPTYPYVRIGAIEPRPVRTDSGMASDVAFSIEAHSRPVAGRVEATRIAEAVYNALENAALSVTGYTTVYVNWLAQTVERDNDGQSYVAISAFETLLDA